MHICCWIVFLQHYAKMTKCSSSQITERSLGGRRISMEFALYAEVLWPWFCKKENTKNSDHSFMSPVKHGICFWCRTVINWLSTYTSNGTTRHSPERLSLGVSRAVKENSWFWNVELPIYGYGLQVFIELPHVLPHIPILVLKINQLWLGREYHFWAPAALPWRSPILVLSNMHLPWLMRPAETIVVVKWLQAVTGWIMAVRSHRKFIPTNRVWTNRVLFWLPQCPFRIPRLTLV